MQLSGELDPLQVAVTVAPLSTWKVNVPVGAVPPEYATLAARVVLTVPIWMLSGVTVIVGAGSEIPVPVRFTICVA